MRVIVRPRVATVAVASICISLLAGCASNSGVVPVGQDTFLISKQAATGFSGLGTLKAEVYQAASETCSRGGKTMETTTYSESQPPFILGNFPRVDLTFRCR